MSFRLVPNSVTLDDLERRYSPNRRVILPNSVPELFFGCGRHETGEIRRTAAMCTWCISTHNLYVTLTTDTMYRVS